MNSILKKGGLKSRLIIIASVLLCITTLTVGLNNYRIAKNELDKNGQIILEGKVNAVMQLIEVKNNEIKEGKTTTSKAHEEVKEFMLGKINIDGTRSINDNMKIGESGYLVAYSKDGVELAHPTLEGQSVWNTEDTEGNLFVQEIIDVGINGGGYVGDGLLVQVLIWMSIMKARKIYYIIF